MPRTAKPKRSRGYHHGDLRRALLDAACELAAQHGPANVSLREAARIAGVSEAAPYRHFADKDALLSAVAEEGLQALTVAMRDAAAKRHGDPLARFQATGVAYVRFAVANAAKFRIMFGPAVRYSEAVPALWRAARETGDVLLDAVVECQRAGLVRDGDPRELAAAAWSIVHGAASLLIDGQLPCLGIDAVDTERLAEQMTARLYGGLRPETPASRSPRSAARRSRA